MFPPTKSGHPLLQKIMYMPLSESPVLYPSKIKRLLWLTHSNVKLIYESIKIYKNPSGVNIWSFFQKHLKVHKGKQFCTMCDILFSSAKEYEDHKR